MSSVELGLGLVNCTLIEHAEVVALSRESAEVYRVVEESAFESVHHGHTVDLDALLFHLSELGRHLESNLHTHLRVLAVVGTENDLHAAEECLFI